MKAEFDVDFLAQLVDSMADAVEKLESLKEEDSKESEKLRVFIMKLQKKIAEVCND